MKTIFGILLFAASVTTVALAQTSPLTPATDVAREIEEASQLYFAALDRGDELKKLFPSLRVLRYEEPEDISDFGLQKVRLVRLIARKEK